MTLTTLNASGQITLPSKILKWLNLKPGDKIEERDRAQWQSLHPTCPH